MIDFMAGLIGEDRNVFSVILFLTICFILIGIGNGIWLGVRAAVDDYLSRRAERDADKR